MYSLNFCCLIHLKCQVSVYYLSYYSKKTLQICVSFSAMKMPVCIAPSKVSFLDGAHSFLSSEEWNASSMRCFMTSSFDSLLGYRTQKFGSTEFRSTLVVSAWTSKIILQDLQPCRPWQDWVILRVLKQSWMTHTPST
jgi:hypothetical protein